MNPDVILAIESGLGALFTVAFVIRYSMVYGWWQTAIGWQMMGQSFILAAMFIMILIGRFIGGVPIQIWIVAMALFVAIQGLRYAILEIVKYKTRRSLRRSKL